MSLGDVSRLFKRHWSNSSIVKLYSNKLIVCRSGSEICNNGMTIKEDTNRYQKPHHSKIRICLFVIIQTNIQIFGCITRTCMRNEWQMKWFGWKQEIFLELHCFIVLWRDFITNFDFLEILIFLGIVFDIYAKIM